MVFPPKKKDYIIKKKINNKKMDNLINDSINAFSSQVIVYKNGEKILDLKNKNDNKIIRTYSVTKSFCALAIMFLIQDKKIKSVNDKISDYIKSWKYGKKKDITIEHILTHTSGLDKHWNYDDFMFPEGKIKLFLSGKGKKPNVQEISLVIDKVQENDKEWFYNDTATQLIPTLVHVITKIQIDKYLNKKLFKPLNIKFKWNKDDDGNAYGPNGILMSGNDLCKIGLLILNNGKWENKKILDNKLINQMVKKRIDKKEIKKDFKWSRTTSTGYGYLWWNHKNINYMYGFLGQYLLIDKKNKIVAIRLIQSRWENKNFEKETQKDNLHFNNFKNLIEKL